MTDIAKSGTEIVAGVVAVHPQTKSVLALLPGRHNSESFTSGPLLFAARLTARSARLVGFVMIILIFMFRSIAACALSRSVALLSTSRFRGILQSKIGRSGGRPKRNLIILPSA